MERTMKKFAMAAFAALMIAAGAQAGEMKIPKDAPIASITLPESWIGKDTDTGIEVSSPDDAIYFYIDVADAKSPDQVIEDSIDFLAGEGVTIDPKTQKETHDKLNGMEMASLDWDGTDADGPVSISLVIIAPNPQKLLILTYWGTKGEQEKHDADLVSIILSLKPIK